MSREDVFNVVCTGSFVRQTSPADALDAFAKLAKINSQKAKAIVLGQRAVKKAIPHGKAYQLKSKLESVGIEIKLQRVVPAIKQNLSLEPTAPSSPSSQPLPAPAGATAMTLALEPMDSPPQDDESSTDSTTAEHPPQPALATNEMRCPKCELQQVRAQACSGCGVIIAKAEKALLDEPNLSRGVHASSSAALQNSSAPATEELEAGVSRKKVLFAAGVAAVLGALAWQFVAITFNIELGILAWAIGGFIGAVAVFYGAEGDNAGYLCGVLALLAILGGKYLIASSLTEDYFGELQSELSSDELNQMSENVRREAEFMRNALASEEALRTFLIETQYVAATDPWAIDQQTVDSARQELEVAVEEFQIIVDMYAGDELHSGLGSVATTEVFKASFDWIDILFILLGVSTAYRLASEGNIRLLRRR